MAPETAGSDQSIIQEAFSTPTSVDYRCLLPDARGREHDGHQAVCSQPGPHFHLYRNDCIYGQSLVQPCYLHTSCDVVWCGWPSLPPSPHTHGLRRRVRGWLVCGCVAVIGPVCGVSHVWPRPAHSCLCNGGPAPGTAICTNSRLICGGGRCLPRNPHSPTLSSSWHWVVGN